MQTKQKPTLSGIIRYWHPRKGGWYHARLVKAGRKWAYVRPLLAAPNGIIFDEGRRMRVPVGNLKEGVL